LALENMGSNYMAVLHRVVCKDLWDLEDRQVLEVLSRHRIVGLVVLVRQRQRINRILGRMLVYQLVAVHPHKVKDKLKTKVNQVGRALRVKAFTATDSVTVLGDQVVEVDLKQAVITSKAGLRVTLDILRVEMSQIFTHTSQGSNRLIGSSLN